MVQRAVLVVVEPLLVPQPTPVAVLQPNHLQVLVTAVAVAR